MGRACEFPQQPEEGVAAEYRELVRRAAFAVRADATEARERARDARARARSTRARARDVRGAAREIQAQALDVVTAIIDEEREPSSIMAARLGRLSTGIGRSPAIEQAKAWLVGEYGITHGEAFELLVAISNRSNRKLRDVALRVPMPLPGADPPDDQLAMTSPG